MVVKGRVVAVRRSWTETRCRATGRVSDYVWDDVSVVEVVEVRQSESMQVHRQRTSSR